MIKVLYVDDEQLLLDVAKDFLESTSEFKVGIAISAKEALASSSIGSYDAIISDYHMPEMDGIAFLKEVREEYGDLPFILFTGRGREEVVINAINNGADFYLQKGGEPRTQFAEIVHMVRQAVRRRKAELERIRSEEKFSKLFINNPSLEIITDFITGKMIDVNNAFIRATGYNRDDVMGKSTHEINLYVNYADREMMRKKLTTEGILQHLETKIRTKSGDILTLDYTGQRIRVGESDYIFSQGIDITERKQAEDALRMSEERLLAQYMHNPLAILTWQKDNDDFVLIRCNTAALKLSGRRAANWIGHTASDLFSSQPEVLSDLQRTYSEKRVFSQEITSLVIFPKKYIRTTAAYTPPDMVIVHIEDITERKHAEEALKESEERYRAVFEAESSVIFLTDKETGIIIDCNDAVTDLYGYQKDELIGQPNTIISAEPEKTIRDRIKPQNKIPLRHHQKKDGTKFSVEIQTRVISIQGRSIIVATVREISERRGN